MKKRFSTCQWSLLPVFRKARVTRGGRKYDVAERAWDKNGSPYTSVATLPRRESISLRTNIKLVDYLIVLSLASPPAYPSSEDPYRFSSIQQCSPNSFPLFLSLTRNRRPRNHRALIEVHSRYPDWEDVSKRYSGALTLIRK